MPPKSVLIRRLHLTTCLVFPFDVHAPKTSTRREIDWHSSSPSRTPLYTLIAYPFQPVFNPWEHSDNALRLKVRIIGVCRCQRSSPKHDQKDKLTIRKLPYHNISRMPPKPAHQRLTLPRQIDLTSRHCLSEQLYLTDIARVVIDSNLKETQENQRTTPTNRHAQVLGCLTICLVLRLTSPSK